MYTCILYFISGDVSAQLTAPPPTCPGDTFSFRCTVSGDMRGVTISRVGGSIECYLVHRATSSSICGPGDVFKATPETGFGISATSFSSTLSGTATSELNGTLVECFGPANNVQPGNRVGSSTLQILGQWDSICCILLWYYCAWFPWGCLALLVSIRAFRMREPLSRDSLLIKKNCWLTDWWRQKYSMRPLHYI